MLSKDSEKNLKLPQRTHLDLPNQASELPYCVTIVITSGFALMIENYIKKKQDKNN